MISQIKGANQSVQVWVSAILNNIRGIRAQKGISQKTMGNHLGIGQAGYAKMENGGTEITVQRLGEISEILEVDVLTLQGIDRLMLPHIEQLISEKEAKAKRYKKLMEQKDITIEALMEKLKKYEQIKPTEDNPEGLSNIN